MNRIFVIPLTFVFFVSFSGLFAQNFKHRIEPGRLYSSGDSIHAPRYGFAGQIPQGWSGVLPRETEVFLLRSVAGTSGEIFVFGRKKIDLPTLAKTWEAGVKLSETVSLRAIDPSVEGDLLSAQVEAVGNYLPPKNYRAFAATRCGESCITVLAISSDGDGSAASEAALALLRSAHLSSPKNTDPYQDFDWQEFLSGKLLIEFEGYTGVKNHTAVTLCGDGSFQAKVSKKGMIQDSDRQYKGKLKGAWTVEGQGAQATLKLIFEEKELSPFVANLAFVDGELQVNGVRHYASESTKCD